MIYEIVSVILGFFKIVVYKVLNPIKVSFKSIPKMNASFNLAIKGKSKLTLGKKFRSRNNISFRVYSNGKITIGNNCFMNDGCSINCREHITIGDNVILGQNVMIFDHDHDYKNDISEFITGEVVIGSNVWIGANTVILKGVKIGNNCVIAAGTIVNKDIESNSMIYQKRESIVTKVK